MWGDLPDGGSIRKSKYLFELAECHIVMVYSAITNRCHLPDAINNIGGLQQFYTRLNSGSACLSNLGKPVHTKMDEFSEKFRRGSLGSFPIQKFMLQNLDI